MLAHFGSATLTASSLFPLDFSYTGAVLDPGQYTVEAYYTPAESGSFLGSSASTTVTVVTIHPTVVVSTTPSASASAFQAVTITATVSASIGSGAGGTVQLFHRGLTMICIAIPVMAGPGGIFVASFTVSGGFDRTLDVESITAIFGGSKFWSIAEGNAQLTINTGTCPVDS